MYHDAFNVRHRAWAMDGDRANATTDVPCATKMMQQSQKRWENKRQVDEIKYY